jgi:hypothetical protein
MHPDAEPTQFMHGQHKVHTSPSCICLGQNYQVSMLTKLTCFSQHGSGRAKRAACMGQATLSVRPFNDSMELKLSFMLTVVGS